MNNVTLRTGCAIHILGTCKRGPIQCIQLLFWREIIDLVIQTFSHISQMTGKARGRSQLSDLCKNRIAESHQVLTDATQAANSYHHGNTLR